MPAVVVVTDVRRPLTGGRGGAREIADQALEIAHETGGVGEADPLLELLVVQAALERVLA